MTRPFLYGEPVNKLIFRASPQQEAYLRSFGSISDKVRELIDNDIKKTAMVRVQSLGLDQGQLQRVWGSWDQKYNWFLTASKQEIIDWIEGL